MKTDQLMLAAGILGAAYLFSRPSEGQILSPEISAQVGDIASANVISLLSGNVANITTNITTNLSAEIQNTLELFSRNITDISPEFSPRFFANISPDISLTMQNFMGIAASLFGGATVGPSSVSSLGWLESIVSLFGQKKKDDTPAETLVSRGEEKDLISAAIDTWIADLDISSWFPSFSGGGGITPPGQAGSSAGYSGETWQPDWGAMSWLPDDGEVASWLPDDGEVASWLPDDGEVASWLPQR